MGSSGRNVQESELGESMIDNLRAQIKDEQHLIAVINGIEAMAESNPDLKNLLETTERKIDECWKYIRSKAQKQAKNGTACVEDRAVYEWAVEFFKLPEEEYQKLKEPTKAAPTVTKAEPKEVTKEDIQEEPQEEEEQEVPIQESTPVKREVKKDKPKADDVNLSSQMDIFDFLGA